MENVAIKEGRSIIYKGALIRIESAASSNHREGVTASPAEADKLANWIYKRLNSVLHDSALQQHLMAWQNTLDNDKRKLAGCVPEDEAFYKTRIDAAQQVLDGLLLYAATYETQAEKV